MSIHASLRKGEYVTSIDRADAYLCVPIHTQSQNYLRFCFKGVIYHFTSLPFALTKVLWVSTSIVKEVKLMALQLKIRLHQYLDDWLIRAPSKEKCNKQTQKLLKLKGVRLCYSSKPQEVRTVFLPKVQLPRKPFLVLFGSCEAHTRHADETSGNVLLAILEVCYQ